jgi:hypothetical protein
VVRHKRLLLGPLPLLTFAALAGGAAWATAPRAPAKRTVLLEHDALDAMRAVARGEARLVERKVLDRDRDGVAEHGTVADLAAAGVLETSPPEPGASSLDVAGYRVSVLLPREAERSGRLAFARTAEDVDPKLASRFFAVVAIPREDAPGLRAAYLDAAGRLWIGEGVCDGDRRPSVPPPARSFVEAEETAREGGLIWRLRAGPPLEPPPRPRPAK